jgi:pyridoxal phosphate enzyme (YggS family)
MILTNIELVRQKIARTCAKCGRNPADLTLVAVAKTFPATRVLEAVRARVTDIGENYVQELLKKRNRLGTEKIRWHFIGHLQTNKVKQIIAWVHLIHALDNARLAQELDRRAAETGRRINVLLEVNTTGEATKFGLAPDRVTGFVRSLEGLHNICINGLMTIGPFLPHPEGSRPMFRQLRELREDVARLGLHNVAMEHLSMGMSADFEVAIEEGATILRIGTAIFGSREKPTGEGEHHETHTA